MHAGSTGADSDDDADAAAEEDEGAKTKWGPKKVYECLTDFKYVGALFFLADMISVVNLVSTSISAKTARRTAPFRRRPLYGPADLGRDRSERPPAWGRCIVHCLHCKCRLLQDKGDS